MNKNVCFSKYKVPLLSTLAAICLFTPLTSANAKRHYHHIRRPRITRVAKKQRSYHKREAAYVKKRIYKHKYDTASHKSRNKEVRKSAKHSKASNETSSEKAYIGKALYALHNNKQINNIKHKSTSYSVGVRDSNYRKQLQKKYLFGLTPYRYLRRYPYSYSEQSRFVKFMYHEFRHHGIDAMHSRAIITSIAAEQGRYIKNSKGFYFTFQQYTKKEYVHFCKVHKLPLTDPLSGVKCFEAIRPAQFNRFLHLSRFWTAYPYFRLAIEVGVNAYPKLNANWTSQMLNM